MAIPSSSDLHPVHDAAKIRDFFRTEHPEIEFVRFQWVDVTAVVRTRMVTVRQAVQLASKPGHTGSINVASPIVNGFLVDGSFNEINAGKKDDLIPDWSTLKPCYYAPGHAMVMCFISEPDQDFATCPRTLLKRLQCRAEEEHGIKFLVGIEIEFYLMPSPAAGHPVQDDVAAYCSTASLRASGGNYLRVLEDAVRAIEKAEIPVWTFHTELVAGLFELQTEPLTPLEAADATVYIHECIKMVASRHGLHATMHPKPFDKTHGVGQHMHISFTPTSSVRNTKANPDGFLASILRSVPALAALTMPNYDSYLRRSFMGGDWVCWDTENRTASVRKIKHMHWEFRFVDGSANNYLALLAILGVGMNGIEEGMVLGLRPLGATTSDELEDDKTRESLGVRDRLPSALEQAVAALEQDHVVRNVLGPVIAERYTRYKMKECKMLAKMTLEERRLLCIAIF